MAQIVRERPLLLDPTDPQLALVGGNSGRTASVYTNDGHGNRSVPPKEP